MLRAIFATSKGAFNASRSAGLLPAFGWALLLVAVLTAGVTGWAVHRWDKGAEALRADKTLRKDIDELTAAARQLQQSGVDSAIAYDQATGRMDAIAVQRETDREENRLFLERQRTELDQLLLLRADLRALRVGAGVLHHWNQSNQGPATTPAATPKPAGQPARTVPGAAAGQQRRVPGAAGQPRRSGRAVPRLQGQPGQLAAGAGRVGGHRVALVLQRGGGGRPGRIGVPQA